MSDFNPYQQPQADVTGHLPSTLLDVQAPRRRPFGHGAGWLADAWRIFTLNGWLWIGGALVLWIVQMAISSVPLLGMFASVVLGPMIYAGAYIVARKSDQGQAIAFEDFFAGFQTRPGVLLALGGVSLGMFVAICAIGLALGWALLGADAVSTLGALDAGTAPPLDPLSQGAKVLLLVLVLTALSIPYMALVWFAVPLLLFSDGMTVGRAMHWSFVGTMKNILPMTLYGLLLVILTVVAVIPLMLGLLVLMPVMMISVYTSFRDIYADATA